MNEIIKFINHHIILSILWINLFIIVIFTIYKQLISKVKSITCSEVIHLVNKHNAIIVDLRRHNDFHDGHIIGSINLLPSEIKSNNIIRLNKHKKKPIILVDKTNVQIYSVANLLEKKGFKKLFWLKDGIYKWNLENLPLIKGKSED